MTGPVEIEALIIYLPVHDLEATRDFYGRDLALELLREGGGRLVFKIGGGHLGFQQCQDSNPLPGQAGPILTLISRNSARFYQYLRRLGVETEIPPPHYQRRIGVHFRIRDPDGYRLEVQQSPAPTIGFPKTDGAS